MTTSSADRKFRIRTLNAISGAGLSRLPDDLYEVGGSVEEPDALLVRSAKLLYGFIDSSDFYTNPVQERSRSWMNVPFTLADPARDADFLAGAQAAGLTNLKGHRSVGGMRASIYNAMPIEGVRALIDYMTDFAARA